MKNPKEVLKHIKNMDVERYKVVKKSVTILVVQMLIY